MNVACIHYEAVHFADKTVAIKGSFFNDCCSHRATLLQTLPEFPSQLKALFENEHVYSNEFFTNIHHYNNSFSFAIFNANLANLSAQQRGPYCYKIQ